MFNRPIFDPGNTSDDASSVMHSYWSDTTNNYVLYVDTALDAGPVNLFNIKTNSKIATIEFNWGRELYAPRMNVYYNNDLVGTVDPGNANFTNGYLNSMTVYTGPPIVIKQNAAVTPEGPDIDRIILRNASNNEIPYRVVVSDSYRFHPASDPNHLVEWYPDNPLHKPTIDNLNRLIWTSYEIEGDSRPVAQTGDTLMTLYPQTTVASLEIRKFRENRRYDFQIEYLDNVYYASNPDGSSIYNNNITTF